MLLPRRFFRSYKLPIKNKNHVRMVSSSHICLSSSTKTKQDNNFKGKYDVIIAGGGMVGFTLACAMAKDSLLSSLKVLLLEGSPNKKYTIQSEYSNRVVALNPNTKALMCSIDVWPHIEKIRVQPVRHMQVWDACSDALITFSSSDILDNDVAYIVENDLILDSVSKVVKSDAKNVNVVYGAKISEYELPQKSEETSECIVKMSNGDTYSCSLLIGADGANSAVRQAIGSPYLSWNYDQMGVVATLYLAEECENNTAWQRFLPTGPVALLPLDSQRSSLVWSTTQDHAKELLKLPDEQFVDALNDALWKQYPRNGGVEAAMSWLGGVLRRGGLADGGARQLPPSVRRITPASRAAFPLGFGHAARYVAPSVALVGDAAHRVHPLAGQGVNLGFGDVKELTQYLSEALYAGFDITHPSWLSKYESRRQRHNVPTALCVDALHRLYSLQLPPAVLLRSLGLQLTNAATPLKKLIMSHATT